MSARFTPEYSDDELVTLMEYIGAGTLEDCDWVQLDIGSESGKSTLADSLRRALSDPETRRKFEEVANQPQWLVCVKDGELCLCRDGEPAKEGEVEPEKR